MQVRRQDLDLCSNQSSVARQHVKMTGETTLWAFSPVSLLSIPISYPQCVRLPTQPCLTHLWVSLSEVQPGRIYPSEIKREAGVSHCRLAKERLDIQA